MKIEEIKENILQNAPPSIVPISITEEFMRSIGQGVRMARELQERVIIHINSIFNNSRGNLYEDQENDSLVIISLLEQV